MSDETENFESKRKSRKKLIYQKILQQMEFYFSPANLSKDRWLSSQIMENEDICLTEFLKFNKIRALTDNVNDVAKALEKSQVLTVNENMRVKRTTPVQLKENEDDYVIYVEQVPPDADHDWLKSIFSAYGEIDYVSVPRFKNSNKCKGFAFVEFAKTESAEKAMQDFKERGNYLSTDIAPEELLSIQTHEENGKKDETSRQPQEGEEGGVMEAEGADQSSSEPAPASTPASASAPANPRKRKTSGEPGGVEEKKKMKTETEDKPATAEGRDSSTAEESSEVDEGGKIKKKKNRKKKNKKKKTKGDVGNAGLQILSKRDWKRLRNKYLNMQKEKMKQLKKHLNAQRKSEMSRQRHHEEKPKGRGGHETLGQDVKFTKEKRDIPKLKFEKGLIVRIKLEEPVIEVKTLKNEIKTNSSVKFVDVKEGSCVVHVRFDSTEAAADFSQNSSYTHATLLQDEEEAEYWEKLEKARAQKLTTKVTKKARGKEKLMKKAEKVLGKHIIFDDV